MERKVFPGYVLVKMVMTDETWHLVRNVRGVTGFVGSGNKPIPLTEEEIAALGVEKARSRGRLCRWATTSRSPTAPWSPSWAPWRRSTWTGSKVRVVVSMFGRETPVELELDQVEPVQADLKHPARVRSSPVRGARGRRRPAPLQSNHIYHMEVLLSGTESNWIR